MPADAFLVACVTVSSALIADGFLGEPPARWHPVVWIGSYLRHAGQWLLSIRIEVAKAAGCAAWMLGASVCVAVGWAVQAVLLQQMSQWPLVAAVIIGLILKPLLALRMLCQEVYAVEQALLGSLGLARVRIARLVSRNTEHMSASEAREASIETLAENFCDSVVAPLFWFAVAGLPGAALYRYANTADAMWGYRGRWERVGWCAAKVDDLLSWVPARVAAALLCLAAWQRPRLASLRAEASKTPSPNGGWPMGTMALLLNVRLRKPDVYDLHSSGREAQRSDTLLAISLVRWATFIGAAVAAAGLGLSGALR